MTGGRMARRAAVACVLFASIVVGVPAVAASGAMVNLFVADRNSPVPTPSGNLVNLYAAGDIPAIRPGGSGWTTLEVGNTGGQPTTGPVRAVYVTALYANIDNNRKLPVGCVKLLNNPNPTVPEIVQC